MLYCGPACFVSPALPPLKRASPQTRALQNAAPHSPQEVVGLGLVAIEPLEDGDEVVFNYRLSPGLGRPQWYVPLDGVEEDRRWA